MKKLLTITATIEVESTDDYPVNTYKDCLNDYDNIGRPINRLEDLGWDVKFESLKTIE